jgi:FlaA1/EpsC-like NDP-sugar epimerase
MLRENQYILRQINIALDLLLSIVAFFLAHLIRQALNIYVFPDWSVASLSNYIRLLPAVPLVAVAALMVNGIYNSQRMRTRTRELVRQIAVACLEAALVLTAVAFMVNRDQTSRPFIVILPLVLFILIVARNWVLRRMLMRVRRNGLNYRNVIVIGSGQPLAELVRIITSHPFWGLKIEGLVTDRPEFQGAAFDAAAVPESGLGFPVLSDLGRASEVLWRTPVDEVIFAPDAAPLSQLRPLMEICEEMGVRTHLPLNFYNTRIAHPVVDRFDELPVLSYWPTQVIGPALLFKYAFDRVAALLDL